MGHHEHCTHELRLACLQLAVDSATHKDDLDEVLALADTYFDFVVEHPCEG